MTKNSSSIPMSQIIASDAPLLSPVGEAPWDHHQSLHSPTNSDSFGFNYYNTPPSPPTSIGSTGTDSPISTSRMLKMRMSPDSGSESDQQLCLPTHQVFDLPEFSNSPSPSESPKSQRLSISTKPDSSTSPAPTKRSASPAPAGIKKPRAVGERVNSKDFIPPDVSGLSKREARLVKNRAAAFLSRQRKREEFECMEVRVAELEQENARLLALSQNGRSSHSTTDSSNSGLVSEIDKLRAQLAAAEKREQELCSELAKNSTPRDVPVKVESVEPHFSSSPARGVQSLHKSGASLGLMVLLCALPTLLSMPAHSAIPTTFSLPISSTSALSTSTYDYNSMIPNEHDWSHQSTSSSMMDLDYDDHVTASSSSMTKNTRKLEFVDGESGLNSLDISFDTVSSENGKIRVRIHPSSPSSGSSSPTSSYSTKLEPSSLAMWAGSDSSAESFALSSIATSSGSDPFLGVGSFNEFAHYSRDGSVMSMFGQEGGLSSSVDFDHLEASESGFAFGSDFGVSEVNKKRVRIALKSMPAAGGEGGEWEVQFY